MANFPTVVFSVIATLIVPPAFAGEEAPATAPRKEFRQRRRYPFTFEAVSYLDAGGPKPMRFAPVQSECANRSAPLLPPVKPAAEKKDAGSRESAAPAPNPPAFPPPANGPAAGGPDLSKVPDEVMTYFKNPYNAPSRAQHLFDPIFEPGVNQSPPSKATYHLTNKP